MMNFKKLFYFFTFSLYLTIFTPNFNSTKLQAYSSNFDLVEKNDLKHDLLIAEFYFSKMNGAYYGEFNKGNIRIEILK